MERLVRSRSRAPRASHRAATALAAAALLAALVPSPAVRAHPVFVDDETILTSSQALARALREQPLRAVAEAGVDDPRAPDDAGRLDIASVRVRGGRSLRVEVTLHAAVVPGDEELQVHLVHDGDLRPRWTAFQPEGGEWGLYELDLASFRYVRIGDASMRQDGAALTVEIPWSALPADGLAVYVQTNGLGDDMRPYTDVAPNDRTALLLPPPARRPHEPARFPGRSRAFAAPR